MRRYALILLLPLLSAGKLHAFSVDTDKPSQSDETVTQPPETRTYQAPEKTGKKTTAPVSVFTPTEKISADSAVSFPVDI